MSSECERTIWLIKKLNLQCTCVWFNMAYMYITSEAAMTEELSHGLYASPEVYNTYGIANPEGWGFIITIQQSFFSSFQNSALAKIPCLKASAPLNRHWGFPVTERQIMIFAFHPWTYAIYIYEKILYDLKVIYLTFFHL